MADIFISYSKTDRAVAAALANELRSAGYSVWWDADLAPGEVSNDVIRRRIFATKATIVVWSATSIRSQWVNAEATLANQLGKLISVRVGSLSDVDIPLPFNTVHVAPISNRLAIASALSQRGVFSNHAAPSNAKEGRRRAALFILLLASTEVAAMALRADMDIVDFLKSRYWRTEHVPVKSAKPDLIEASGSRNIELRGSKNAQEESQKLPVVADSQAAPSDANNFVVAAPQTPDDAPGRKKASSVSEPLQTVSPFDVSANLLKDTVRLRDRIKFAEEKFALGNQATKSWDEQSLRVKSLIDSHDKQAAACEIAKQDLKRRVENGTPDVFLSDGKRHVAECDEARRRYRGMIASLETSVAKMRVTVDHIVENMNQLGTQQTEQLQRKKVLDQLIGATSSTVKNDIDAFTKKQLSH